MMQSYLECSPCMVYARLHKDDKSLSVRNSVIAKWILCRCSADSDSCVSSGVGQDQNAKPEYWEAAHIMGNEKTWYQSNSSGW